MSTATVPRADVAPVLDHRAWMELAATEYRRHAELFSTLGRSDWGQPTDCTDWDVQAMVAHLVGTAEGDASVIEGARQLWTATRTSRRDGTLLVDALSALQVEERSDLDPEQLIANFDRAWPRALRARTRLPRLMRSGIRIAVEVPGIAERWTLGYFMDCIRTRDSWLHRVDIARATGAHLELTAEHDGVIIADIVAEWAGRHGQPFRLELTGPAGGAFESSGTSPAGTGAAGTRAGGTDEIPRLTIDAVEFCRVISGRAPGEGLLAQAVPF